jgi:hypothetical protein
MHTTRTCKPYVSTVFVYLRIYLCILSVPFMQTCVKTAGHFCSSTFEILRIHAPVVDMFLQMQNVNAAKKASLNVVFIEQWQNAYKNQLITLDDRGCYLLFSGYWWFLITLCKNDIWSIFLESTLILWRGHCVFLGFFIYS